jgi:ribosomal subunit interface protein
MQIEPQITFRDMQPSAAIEYAIRERLARLENFHDRITSCRVVVQAPHRHGQKGRIYRIAIDIDVPGGNVVVNREPGQNHAHEDIHVAIRDAFSAAQRQLEDHVRKASGYRVKEHPAKEHGTVARIFPDEGYGFILTEPGEELFFQRASVTGDDWLKLDAGSRVHFTPMDGEKGPYAVAVTVAE